MSAAEERNKLKRMRDEGTITDEQYERAAAELEEARRPRRRARDEDDDGSDELSPRERKKKACEWAMVLHLSLFAGHAVPFGGIVAPIVIWQIKKDELPGLDAHGRNAVNWIISSVIYAVVCIPLCFVIVGIPLLIALGVLNVVFPIIAAVKANEGKLWKYPLAIRFLS